ncbi:conjugal transfer pilus acetylase TraX [Escherichia coli]
MNTYRWQGGEQRPATIISEPDRNVRYARLAGDFAASVKAGEESVAQVSGVREQAILTQAIRSELKTQGVLGHPEVTMTALSPVWLDSRSRYLRDMYRPGMVMEQWNPETRSHDRYVIDRVTAQSHSLTLRDAQGETQVVRISSLDSSWSLFRPEKMPVADGERLRVTGKIPGLRVSGGDRLQVASVSEDAMTVVVPGRAEPASLPVSDSPFTALKLENGWVETPGHSVSDSAKVFASVTQMAMDNATLNGLARSGRDVRLYSSLDETRTAEKLVRHPSFTVVSEQIKARAGETSLETAISLQKAGLHTPAQQAIHLALPVLESKNLAFSMVDLLTEAKSFAAEGTGFTELGGEINAQIKRGDLLYVDVAKGYGTGLLVSRASYEAEKSILRHILEGKEAVTPLMERVPGELMETLLDHINLIFQLKQEWMCLAGRGAFPLFALVWGLNLSRHANIRQPAINRLWGWGIIAQFAYYLAGFPWYEGNILFAFAVAAQVLTWCETRSGWRTAAAILLMALWGPLSGTSYGIAGLLMLAVSHRLYRAEDRAERLALVACLLAVIPALNLATSDAAAVAGLLMTVLTVGLVSCAGKSLPRFWPGDFFPVFYACHLAVLGVLAL